MLALWIVEITTGCGFSSLELCCFPWFQRFYSWFLLFVVAGEVTAAWRTRVEGLESPHLRDLAESLPTVLASQVAGGGPGGGGRAGSGRACGVRVGGGCVGGGRVGGGRAGGGRAGGGRAGGGRVGGVALVVVALVVVAVVVVVLVVVALVVVELVVAVAVADVVHTLSGGTGGAEKRF